MHITAPSITTTTAARAAYAARLWFAGAPCAPAFSCIAPSAWSERAILAPTYELSRTRTVRGSAASVSAWIHSSGRCSSSAVMWRVAHAQRWSWPLHRPTCPSVRTVGLAPRLSLSPRFGRPSSPASQSSETLCLASFGEYVHGVIRWNSGTSLVFGPAYDRFKFEW